MRKLFRVSLLVFASMFFLVSCEKDDSFAQEEGLKSTTGDQEIPIAVSQPSEAELVFHKHYDGSLTAAEADAKWNEDKAKFEITSNLKDYSTEWFYDVRTNTGTQTGNGTDDIVKVLVYFTCNLSANLYYSNWNSIGASDPYFEGGWDYFLVRDYIYDESVQWVELKEAILIFIGTDEWYVKDFQVRLEPGDQTVSATGYSEIISEPEIWFDNSSFLGMDLYPTGSIGTGRLSF